MVSLYVKNKGVSQYLYIYTITCFVLLQYRLYDGNGTIFGAISSAPSDH